MTMTMNTITTTRHASRRGFSLLELTLVLLIIGLLAGMAAWNLVGQAEKAKVKTTRGSMNLIKSAIEQYQLDKNAYPASLNDLVTDKYLEAKSLKDAWAQPWYYASPSGLNDGMPYALLSGGGDKDFTTRADNISVWDLDKEQ